MPPLNKNKPFNYLPAHAQNGKRTNELILCLPLWSSSWIPARASRSGLLASRESYRCLSPRNRSRMEGTIWPATPSSTTGRLGSSIRTLRPMMHILRSWRLWPEQEVLVWNHGVCGQAQVLGRYIPVHTKYRFFLFIFFLFRIIIIFIHPNASWVENAGLRNVARAAQRVKRCILCSEDDKKKLGMHQYQQYQVSVPIAVSGIIPVSVLYRYLIPIPVTDASVGYRYRYWVENYTHKMNGNRSFSCER